MSFSKTAPRAPFRLSPATGVAILAGLLVVVYFAGSCFDGGQSLRAAEAGSLSSASLVRAAFSLLFVVGLIVALSIVMRRVQNRARPGKSGQQMQITGSILIGAKKQIVMLRVMNRVLVLGITDASINKLAEFADPLQAGKSAESVGESVADFESLLGGWRA